jgi:hypothetical protein
MEIDAVKLDAPNGDELSADYWRERAECLEEWLCELLKKNQAIRMDLERSRSQHQHLQESMFASSLLRHHKSSSARTIKTEPSTVVVVDASAASCSIAEGAEIREPVFESTVMMEFGPTSND